MFGSSFDMTDSLAAYSPVEFTVVIMCLPPEVEPDQQQTEGKKEDEGP